MTQTEFTAVAHALIDWTRKLDWPSTPGFRVPAKSGTRSITRVAGQGIMVNVVLGDRPTSEVIGDMVDGLLIVNERPIGGPVRRSLIRVANETLGRMEREGA